MRREATAPARPVHITLSDDLSSIASILVILLNNTLFKNQGYLMAAKGLLNGDRKSVRVWSEKLWVRFDRMEE